MIAPAGGKPGSTLGTMDDQPTVALAVGSLKGMTSPLEKG
jgi:hypothetical protein